MTLRPPAHCMISLNQLPSSNSNSPPRPSPSSAVLHRSTSTSSDTLPETMNPFMAFSSEELKGMADELAGSSDDDDSEDSDEESDSEEGEKKGEEKGGGNAAASDSLLGGTIRGGKFCIVFSAFGKAGCV